MAFLDGNRSHSSIAPLPPRFCITELQLNSLIPRPSSPQVLIACRKYCKWSKTGGGERIPAIQHFKCSYASRYQFVFKSATCTIGRMESMYQTVYCSSGNFSMRVFNFRHWATRRKLNARTFPTRKKATQKFPDLWYANLWTSQT